MIGVHLLEVEVLFAYRANTLLLFVGCAGIFLVKLTKAQIFFFSCQQIFIYTAVFGDFFVCHKSGYFYLQYKKADYAGSSGMSPNRACRSCHGGEVAHSATQARPLPEYPSSVYPRNKGGFSTE